MADKILALFARKSLIKNSGADGNLLKKAITSSKMVTGPHYKTMSELEIKNDVGKINTFFSTRAGKPKINPLAVIRDAKQLQQDYYQTQAKKKEAKFRQKEHNRQELIQKRSNSQIFRTEFEAKLMAKRQAEDKKLREQNRLNIEQADSKEVKDMAID